MRLRGKKTTIIQADFCIFYQIPASVLKSFHFLEGVRYVIIYDI
jgi:hypothetical protein